MRTQLGKYIRGYVVGSTIGTVQYNMQTFKTKAPRHGALTKLDITPGGIRNTARLAELFGGRHLRFQLLLDHVFQFIRQFAAIATKKLDAIVHVTIVRSTDHYARLSLESTSQISHTRRRH